MKGFVNFNIMKKNNNFIISSIDILIKNKTQKIENDHNNNNFIINEFINIVMNNMNNNICLFVYNLNIVGFLIINNIEKNYKIDIKIFNLELYHLIINNKNKKIYIKCFNKLLSKNVIKLLTNKYFKKNKNKTLTLKDIYNDLNTIMKYFNISINKNNIISLSNFAYKCFFKYYNIFNIKKFIPMYIDAYVRESYFGGRCEVFNNPENNCEIEYIDYNGMYSLCMEELFPIGDGYFVFSSFDINTPGFYEISYKSDNIYLPVLPHKNKLNDKLMFCNGINKGIYWHEEILLFIEKGGVINKIHSGYIFNKIDFVFKEFIEKVNKMKEKNDIFKKIGKIIINSLYGRLGMSKKTYKTIIVNNSEINNILFKNGIRKTFQVNNYWIVEYDSDIIKIQNNNNNININNLEIKSNIIYASIITSKARIKLYKTMDQILKKNAKLLYCDTDSIFYSFKKNQEIFLNLENVKKFEKKIIDAVFISSKSYAIKFIDNSEKIIFKGIDCKNLKFDNLKKKFFKKKKFFYNKTKIIFKKKFFLKEKIIKKKIFFNKYDKRKFYFNLKKTKPFYTEDNIYY